MSFQQAQAQRRVTPRPALFTDLALASPVVNTTTAINGAVLNNNTTIATPSPSAALQVSQNAFSRKYSHSGTDEWILFSPEDLESTTTTTDNDPLPSIDGITDLASIDSLLGSFGPVIATTTDENDGEEDEDEDGDDADEDNGITLQMQRHHHTHPQQSPPASEGDSEGLDSLDDRLGAFHDPTSNFTFRSFGDRSEQAQSAQQLPPRPFPTHEQFGSLGLDPVQMREHLRQFENQTAPLPLNVHTLQQPDFILTPQESRNQRIEKWRLEQSKALLDEIEKETTRMRKITTRKQSIESNISTADPSSSSSSSSAASCSNTRHSVPIAGKYIQAPSNSSPLQISTDDSNDQNISLCGRFTRKVIHDLMGIDQSILSVIFGQSLPEQVLSSANFPLEHEHDQTREEEPTMEDDFNANSTTPSWEERLLNRIARELGVLVNRLTSEFSEPDAFSTYSRPGHRNNVSSQSYVNLSTSHHNQHHLPQPIPTGGRSHPIFRHKSVPSTPKPSVSLGQGLLHQSASSDMLFSPTFIPRRNTVPGIDTSIWGIEDDDLDHVIEPINRPSSIPPLSNAATTQPTTPQHSPPPTERDDRSYWERDLDIKMVINYLYNRFSSRPSSPTRDRRSSRSISPSGGEKGTKIKADGSILGATTPRPGRPAVSFQPSRSTGQTTVGNNQASSSNRYDNRYQHPSSSTTTTTATAATNARLSAHRRAAVIRANHPLASRVQRSTISTTTPITTTTTTNVVPDTDLPNATFYFSTAAPHSNQQMTNSSCASESTTHSRNISQLNFTTHTTGPETSTNLSLSVLSFPLTTAEGVVVGSVGGDQTVSSYWEVGPESDSGVIV